MVSACFKVLLVFQYELHHLTRAAVFAEDDSTAAMAADINGDADSDGEDISAPVKRRRTVLIDEEEEED